MTFEEIKKGGMLQVLMIVASILLLVISLYFLVVINAKIKETQYIGMGDPKSNVISVSKTGTVYTKPDLAIVTITSTTEAKTASDAITKNREKSAAVLGFLKDQGIQDKDIKTTNYNVYPKYEYVSVSSSSEIYYDRNQKLVGYTATESLEVKIRQLDKIGDITTGAVSKGANDVSGLNFTVENMDAEKAKARSQAIIDAKADAQSIANGLGVKLVKIVNFTESGNYPYYAYEMTKSIGAGVSSAPVATGENKIDVTVNITYEIQ